MKTHSRLFPLLLWCMLLMPDTQMLAQTASDLNEGSLLEHDSENGIFRFKWFGKSGRTYFIQHSENLMQPWLYVPIIESGDESIREWGFTSTGDRFFLRLKYSDIPTTDPAGADFDGDGVPSLWELQHGLDPLAVDSATDADQDGLDAWAEFWLGTDPTVSDSDGDGVNDGGEVAQGADPLGSSADGLVPPSNVTVESTPQGGYVVSWVNNDARATYHILQRSADRMNWTTVAVLPNGTTSYIDQEASAGVALLYALIATDR
jgi:hypothetical protein